MGHLTLQCTPRKWGLPRWCLARPKTYQGRVPQSHECSPHKRGLQMTKGSLDCNRCLYIFERDPSKWGS